MASAPSRQGTPSRQSDGSRLRSALESVHACPSLADQRKSLPSQSMRWRIPASLRAAATVAFFVPIRLGSRVPQDFNADHGEQVCAKQLVAIVLLTGLKASWRQTYVCPTLEDFAKRCGSSITLIYVKATTVPTPGAVISRFTASSVRAIVMRRRLRMAICLLRASQADKSASATSCNGPPATSTRTRFMNGLMRRPPSV
jgi:hypothetical protein